MTRRTLRESIFKILFRYEFNSAEEMDEQIEFAMEELTSADAEDEDENQDKEAGKEAGKEAEKEEPAREKDKRYIVAKAKAVIANIDEIDSIIESVSDGWKLSRIGKAELSIMRLAVYEIKFDEDVPYKVAINEALELAKIYCGPDAKGFVNALLSKIKE
jgi:N utilization substance protein B